MADLTVTVAITASINGRKFAITESMTIEDVYDVVVIGNESTIGYPAPVEFLNDGAASMNQSCPSFAALINTSVAIPANARIRLDDGVNNDYALFGLLPGQFVVLTEHAPAAGIAIIDATTQTTYQDPTAVDVSAVKHFIGYPDARIITAQIAST